ncbi:MAG: hypothetical protein A2284_14495 [Deltaproteobacteria bacterium RIFOXYA12_FULL_61_11]|nr:MAG: hypothetical protein A2284_14495 [Deltaproteobacteria bacterium RIFOXYA12_FULL_61_11]
MSACKIIFIIAILYDSFECMVTRLASCLRIDPILSAEQIVRVFVMPIFLENNTIPFGINEAHYSHFISIIQIGNPKLLGTAKVHVSPIDAIVQVIDIGAFSVHRVAMIIETT